MRLASKKDDYVLLETYGGKGMTYCNNNWDKWLEVRHAFPLLKQQLTHWNLLWGVR